MATQDRLDRAVIIWYLCENHYADFEVPEGVREEAVRWACRVLEGSQSSKEEILASLFQEAALSNSLGFPAKD